MTRADTQDPLIGSELADRYRIVRRIGTGGMGSVYEALHLRTGRVLAIKTISDELLDSSEALRAPPFSTLFLWMDRCSRSGFHLLCNRKRKGPNDGEAEDG